MGVNCCNFTPEIYMWLNKVQSTLALKSYIKRYSFSLIWSCKLTDFLTKYTNLDHIISNIFYKNYT